MHVVCPSDPPSCVTEDTFVSGYESAPDWLSDTLMPARQDIVRTTRGDRLQLGGAKAEEDLFSGRVWTGRQVPSHSSAIPTAELC